MTNLTIQDNLKPTNAIQKPKPIELFSALQFDSEVFFESDYSSCLLREDSIFTKICTLNDKKDVILMEYSGPTKEESKMCVFLGRWNDGVKVTKPKSIYVFSEAIPGNPNLAIKKSLSEYLSPCGDYNVVVTRIASRVTSTHYDVAEVAIGNRAKYLIFCNWNDGVA